MDRANRQLAFNAGRGSYAAAKEATALITDTKGKLSTLFHAEGIADIVFTPSVTHAINQILRGIAISKDSVIYLTPYEHNAVARTIAAIQELTECRVEFIPLKEDLSIDLDQMDYLFSTVPPDLVVMNAISNVTGYILPIAQICDSAKEYDAITVIDAAQAAGLIPINMQTLKADIVCYAGHKTLEGPFGIAGFAIKKTIANRVFPIFTGGTGSNSLNVNMPVSAPEKYEASSPNIVAIAGLNAALKVIQSDQHFEKLRLLTDCLIQKLSTIPKVHVLGQANNNIGIISFVVDGYTAGDVGTILDEEFDIAVRTGYHCAPYIHRYLNDIDYQGTIRVGMGRYNTKEDIDVLIDALKTL